MAGMVSAWSYTMCERLKPREMRDLAFRLDIEAYAIEGYNRELNNGGILAQYLTLEECAQLSEMSVEFGKFLYDISRRLFQDA
jgi:hypothetical protein